MSANVLHFDMASKLRKQLADWREQALRDAQQAARTNDQLRWYARKDSVASTLTTETAPESPSVPTSVARPTDEGDNP